MADPILFAHLPDGRAVHQITLARAGLSAKVLTLGAIVQDLRLDGVDHPLVLGAPTLAPYLNDMRYFGAIVGRYANRIRGAKVHLDGQDWPLDRNWLGAHTLHGGADGVWAQVWTINGFTDWSVDMSLTLPHGHMGFPGNMIVDATLTLDPDTALRIDLRARTDRASPCSFCHHGYFCLTDTPDIAEHTLQIAADSYLPVDAGCLPTGQIAPVAGTQFDFRTPRAVGRQAIDHNFCLSPVRGLLRHVARLEAGGLRMDLETTEAGLQVFTAPHLPAEGLAGLDGRRYGPFAGIALEAQAWPDAPNQPHFPPAILHPGEAYHHITRYGFTRTEGPHP